MTATCYRFGDFRLEALTLWRGAQQVPLTRRELRILQGLVAERGTVVSAERMRHLGWGADIYVASDTVRQTVFTLRRQLGDSAEPHRIIDGNARDGWIFVAAISGHESDNPGRRRGERRTGERRQGERRTTDRPQPDSERRHRTRRHHERRHYSRRWSARRQMLDPALAKLGRRVADRSAFPAA